MTNFKAARTSMVDSQIHTMGVVNEDILNAFRTIPRELFVPEGQSGFAYSDEDMPIGEGRYIMEPVTHARLIQAALPVAGDVVLDIGGATGYSAAILSGIVSHVVAVEENASLLQKASQNWDSLGLANISAQQGAFVSGSAEKGPYSLIIINGSVAFIPPALIDQLAPEGRLLAVVKGPNDRIGRAILIKKGKDGVLSDRILFDAAVPYLPGLQPRTEFVF